MNTNPMLNAIKGIDPEGKELWGRVGGLFDLMEVAEDEIAKAQARHPDVKEKLWDTFRLLQPGHLSEYPDRFYRAHCREILERVYHGTDTQAGTKAEVLTALSKWTLEHAPNGTTAALMSQLFSELVPEHADWGQNIIEAQKFAGVPGATQELHAKLQRKSAIATRRY